jgi:hypothetical protein
MQEWFHCRTVLIKQLYWIEAAILASPVAIRTYRRERERRRQVDEEREREAKAREERASAPSIISRQCSCSLIAAPLRRHYFSSIIPIITPSFLHCAPQKYIRAQWNRLSENNTQYAKRMHHIGSPPSTNGAAFRCSSFSRVENHRHCCCWELLYLYDVVVYMRERSRLLSAGIVRAYCARPGCRNALQLSQFALMCLLLRARYSQSARLNFTPLQQRAHDIALLRPTPRNATAWKSLAKLRKCEPVFPV